MSVINSWIRKGLLPIDPTIASCPDPICAACQHGKSKRRPHKSNLGSITASAHYPGASVSVDQLEAGYPGKIPTAKGLPSHKRYKYVNIWVDNYSKFIFPTFHSTKHASEILQSKAELETYAKRYNVVIERIRADNGVYASQDFQLSCDKAGQDLTFCAVGGHWQNGVAERYIGVITQTARTLLLHAMQRWPSVITEEFWPFAIRHACTFHNASVNPESLQSPHQMFTGNSPPWCMKDFRVFGCPVFVLDKRLQDGDSLPKWRSRCWDGVYVGHSLQHAGNVPLVYNPLTTHVSPQYHVTFDDTFSTVSTGRAVLPESVYCRLYESDDWLFNKSYGDDADLHLFDSFWTVPPAKSSPSHYETHSVRNTHRVSHAVDDSVAFTMNDVCLAATCSSQKENAPDGEHASTRDHAAGDHASTCDHATGDNAVTREDTANETVSTSDFTAQPSNIGPVHDSTAHSAISQTPPSKPYINLQPVACSAAFRAYHDEKGTIGTVYTATSTGTSNTELNVCTLPESSANILHYAFSSSIDPVRQPLSLVPITRLTSSHRVRCSRLLTVLSSSSARVMKFKHYMISILWMLVQ